ncbi:hypothetical protein QJS10_CPA09g01891 [Acorus calamus]|uniref:HMA domain-containing protein n=1 Tax=Acorus calamus TaxID=4465 RepID=A0AAV9E2B1_ACOCL|nr:hypothetical protein QJS10_CPA09g01891 [Acorus calamus]
MASISAFASTSPTYNSIRCRGGLQRTATPLSPSLLSISSRNYRISSPRTQRRDSKTIRALAGEETLAPVEGEGGEVAVAEEENQTVSVPVSPSDMLTMFFKAEGTMSESSVASVTSALEGTEGVSDLKVQVVEGIASVELAKQTTVQATGVASSLVEIIQGAGFKLQTLHLSFEDEEDKVN